MSKYQKTGRIVRANTTMWEKHKKRPMLFRKVGDTHEIMSFNSFEERDRRFEQYLTKEGKS